LSYTRANPYVIEHDPPVPDEIFYFEPQDYNQIDTKIRKRFPDQPYPTSINPDSAQPGELTPDGYLKYFEYEFEIEDLLPSVPYWVNVTAFDFGSPESGLASLETPPSRGAKVAFPQNSWDQIQNQNLKAYVYPNPYRIDEDYRAGGFEGRGEEDRPPDRTRTVMFANIPPKCVIRIYSLDGDLVREIEHDADVSEFETQHRWDLITRNTQMVVSGLYYWTVESEDGETQVGKLAIIM
jgi:hypothetical protein